ncbi:precorrin-2 C(20)-methyltransferase [Porphyromonas asaccharolytica]|uniref:Cobalt-precorrin-2 C(20)-methyltransferase n=1 Tax=Porphyromonas asaccharolytica (strain ATCC 25260 / DSM 20707 / BCRC 10618 / CCUG 7834 / JCM 6326 / LMG 13178 / VPI 4198 / B440) TaxID=879243 RepID=F4KKT1_PORAD|nr:precorrin-2 C(20)-methyltransferase [Porphyromonas asaccharolytica]AEE11964.1 Uroporphyrin-III C/tetrapyrrole (Corrin/Porphyrin) methyltransferase [Porphyromonas asaccharolytica DSM 20707]
MKAPYPIAIVSLGSATPEDISMRAYGKLQAADEIYCLGEAAHRIVAALPEGTVLAQRCQILEIPMSSDRTEAIRYYEQLATRLLDQQGRGLACSVVTIGDAGTYATVQYLVDLLRQAGAAMEVVPGIPYYIAAAAAVGEGLVRQDESLLVLSKVASESQLREALVQGHTVVVMKLSRCADIVREVIAEDNNDFIYAEHLGNPALELLTSDRETLLTRQSIPYFSLIIVRPSRSIPQ